MPTGINVPLGIMFCMICAEALTEENLCESATGFCENCVDEEMAWCGACGDVGHTSYDAQRMLRIDRANRSLTRYERISSVLMRYVDNMEEWYCEGCTSYCETCDTVYASEDEAWECCSEDRYSSEAIFSYSYKPSPLFFDTEGYGTNTNYGVTDQVARWSWRAQPYKLYMGVELEVEKAARFAEDFVHLAKERQGEDPYFVYLKHDGSLSEDGFEIVTMPATLDAFREMFPFSATDMLRMGGARAWAYTNCGLHVHVSRSAFTASHLWKFIKWQTENWDFCVAFAGRNSVQWASWNNQSMTVCKDQTSRAVKARGYQEWSNRYSAINLTNGSTVELRYFRPNLYKAGILRVVEFVQAIYDYTKQMSFGDVFAGRYDKELFIKFMEGKPEYKNAHDYIVANGY